MRPHIEQGDDVLAALGLVFHGDGAMAAGGGFPIDAAVFIVGQVFAQALKFGAFAKLAGVAQANLLQPIFAQQQIVAAHVQQVGVHLHRLGERQLALANGQPERPQPAQVQIAKLVITPAQRVHGVGGFPGAARPHFACEQSVEMLKASGGSSRSQTVAGRLLRLRTVILMGLSAPRLSFWSCSRRMSNRFCDRFGGSPVEPEQAAHEQQVTQRHPLQRGQPGARRHDGRGKEQNEDASIRWLHFVYPQISQISADSGDRP
jgi:hypothetical protein